MDGTKISKAYEALKMLKSIGITPSADQLKEGWCQIFLNSQIP